MTSPDQGRLTPESASGYEPDTSADDLRATAVHDMRQAREWLEDAESVLSSEGDGMEPSQYVHAAASLAGVYVGFAHLGVQQATRVEDLERWAQQREESRENDAIVEESNRLGLEQQRRELALIDQRSDLLAALDRREAQAATEARPHDGEPGSEHVWMPYPDEPGRRCHCAIGHDHDENPTEESDRG